MNARMQNQSITTISTQVSQFISSALSKNCHASKMAEYLQQVRYLLDCLPLDTAEHGMANLRISNAQRFLASKENGAARFEIRMLKGSLKHYMGQQDAEAFSNRSSPGSSKELVSYGVSR